MLDPTAGRQFSNYNCYYSYQIILNSLGEVLSLSLPLSAFLPLSLCCRGLAWEWSVSEVKWKCAEDEHWSLASHFLLKLYALKQVMQPLRAVFAFSLRWSCLIWTSGRHGNRFYHANDRVIEALCLTPSEA